jgi:hypothetical protein
MGAQSFLLESTWSSTGLGNHFASDRMVFCLSPAFGNIAASLARIPKYCDKSTHVIDSFINGCLGGLQLVALYMGGE